jgi:hypothetical protein
VGVALDFAPLDRYSIVVREQANSVPSGLEIRHSARTSIPDNPPLG